MDSFKDVLEAAQSYCKAQMAEPTYNLYIDGLEPISFEDSSHITLSVRNDFICKIVTDRYLGLLKEAFKTVLGFDVDITLVVPSTPPHEVVLAQQYEANPASPQGNYEFTFENFIKGPSNQFAFAAAQAVAANPSGAYNPLFIYGGSGLGKTHLLTAIQTEIKRTHPDFVIMYVTCEQFTNELIAAIRAGSTEDFRMKYRVADLLLVDDIQFIAGKIQTQEEFFHTFNTLYESGKQIVLTSDRPPREMTQLSDRLMSRFESGLMVDVAPPDFETRLAIIHNKAALLGVKLPNEVMDYIAENVTTNVRQLEGTLNKILAYRDLLGDQVDEESVGRAVRDMLKRSNEYVPSPKVIISYICSYYNIDEETLRGQSRSRDVVAARQLAMYLIRRMHATSLDGIGKEFGNRDHSTILHSLDKVEKQMQTDPKFAERVKEITTNISSKR
mgnify:CR=1 FL=1